MGTLWREPPNHFIVPSDGHLRSVVREFVDYYNEARPHQGLEGLPVCEARPQESPPEDCDGRLDARPILGGLRHDYRLAA